MDKVYIKWMMVEYFKAHGLRDGEMGLEDFGKGNSLFSEDGLMISLSLKNDIN